MFWYKSSVRNFPCGNRTNSRRCFTVKRCATATWPHQVTEYYVFVYMGLLLKCICVSAPKRTTRHSVTHICLSC